MRLAQTGRYVARFGDGPDDLRAALSLRSICFRSGVGDDADSFDAVCRHILIEDVENQNLVCTFRILPISSAARADRSYAAQFYDVNPLSGFAGPLVEMGRFCIRPGARDPDVLRLAWGTLGRFVEDSGVELLFGCVSFDGISASRYADAFALLRAYYLMPGARQPRIKASETCHFARHALPEPDRKCAMKAMPPLLRTYLSLGARVSDHVVIDRDLGTLHIFTALEISVIPRQRRATLLGGEAAGLTLPSPVFASP